MEWVHAVILGLIQGITEFLPVSSSAHLILVPFFSDWPDQGLAFDIAVHFGTLFAVMTYFKSELKAIVIEAFNAIRHSEKMTQTLLWKIGVATLPAVIAGLLFHDVIATDLRTVNTIIFTTLVFGIALGVAHYLHRTRIYQLNISNTYALIIGTAQAVALIPGTSRSGITLTAGLLIGMSHTLAARFSFLMSVPIIILASTYECFKLFKSPEYLDWPALAIGGFTSMLSAYLCIYLFLKLLSRIGLMPFVIYRELLACYLIFLTWTN